MTLDPLCKARTARIFTDEQCEFINRLTIQNNKFNLPDIHAEFCREFRVRMTYSEWSDVRAKAIESGRVQTSYQRNYFKGLSSSERELKHQKDLRMARLSGLCQSVKDGVPCGSPTSGRFCEAHAVRAFRDEAAA